MLIRLKDLHIQSNQYNYYVQYKLLNVRTSPAQVEQEIQPNDCHPCDESSSACDAQLNGVDESSSSMDRTLQCKLICAAWLVHHCAVKADNRCLVLDLTECFRHWPLPTHQFLSLPGLRKCYRCDQRPMLTSLLQKHIRMHTKTSLSHVT